ncbi:MAG TPA: AAA family ATPase [Streptosporangiaceae bacterium]|nr:AAA family ATPase [Streptosporangiaceae bacterium]
MSGPGPAPPGEPFARVAETHSAAVFFAGGWAFKVKKPVDLGFLDFSTSSAREAACHAEVELNRRFAPDVYEGVGELRDPAGRVAEHVIMMRRMPASRRLSSLVVAGAPVAGQLREVARQLAAAHAASPRRPDITEQGSRDAVLGRWRANLAQARTLPESALDPAAIGGVEALAERFLAGRQPLFEGRMRSGRIVDGHGDLLSDDIFCLDDGPRILDCLDFDDLLRWLDGLDDAACLAMDLEHIGAAALGQQFTGWYAEFAGDPSPPALVHHYVAYRAFMRAKVTALRAAQGEEPAAGEARRLAAQARRHLRAGAVCMVLVGGLPGTGKSTVAGQLASRLGCTVLSSDRIRKELAGIPATQPCPAQFGSGLYTREWTERTYAELLRRAALLLADGETVVADASWTTPRQRSAAQAMAGSAMADVVQLRCTVPPEVAEQRIRARTLGPSDANPEILRRMAAAASPWPEAVPVDTAAQADALARALAAVRPHGVIEGWST